MIGYLQGILLEKNINQIIVDVNGVGYEVVVSPLFSSTLSERDSRVSVVIFTDVKENSITLYGFKTMVEKQAFLLLKKVKGIGSKLAMVVLSSISPQDLMIAIGKSDFSSLQKIPGIGKKSAERMIVELREQVKEFARDEDGLSHSIEVLSTDSAEEHFSTASQDAILALNKLGFSKEIAKNAVLKASQQAPKQISDAGELLKISLSYLS